MMKVYFQNLADHISSKHTAKILTPDPDINLINSMKIWYDEPFADSSAWPTFAV